MWKMSTQYLVLGFKPTSFSTGVSSNEPLDKGYRQPQRYARLTSTKMHFFILFFSTKWKPLVAFKWANDVSIFHRNIVVVIWWRRRRRREGVISTSCQSIKNSLAFRNMLNRLFELFFESNWTINLRQSLWQAKYIFHFTLKRIERAERGSTKV